MGISTNKRSFTQPHFLLPGPSPVADCLATCKRAWFLDGCLQLHDICPDDSILQDRHVLCIFGQPMSSVGGQKCTPLPQGCPLKGDPSSKTHMGPRVLLFKRAMKTWRSTQSFSKGGSETPHFICMPSFDFFKKCFVDIIAIYLLDCCELLRVIEDQMADSEPWITLGGSLY